MSYEDLTCDECGNYGDIICIDCKLAGYPYCFCEICIEEHACFADEEDEVESGLHDFWSRPNDEQMPLSVQYGEPPKPFTQDELDEMEGCGC